MKFMDRLPTVGSCCYCCYLRAGTVMIAVLSFATGLLFAPNVTQVKGFWDMSVVLKDGPSILESAAQIVMGAASIVLCFVSNFLLVGALCRQPRLIEIYQWGAVAYSAIISLLFLVLSISCFFFHSNGLLAGCSLIGLVVVNIIQIRKACKFIPIRIALIFIGVLSITTGSLMMFFLTKGPTIHFITDIRAMKRLFLDGRKLLAGMDLVMRVVISLMSMVFIFMGLILLVANLLDMDELVVTFVWSIVVNFLIGFMLAMGVIAQCMILDSCILSPVPWFIGAFIMVALVTYLFVWLYFAAVANSYCCGTRKLK